MLANALVYLMAAVIAVPIAKKLGLGSVLGYLIAGVIIGPFALQLVGDQTEVMHFAEFGVVMMLFLVGLELQPSRLWDMRKPILGLGGLQVLVTTVVLTLLIQWALSLPLQTALAIALALTLSSTAIVLQSLTERGLLKTQAGNNAFAVLLFQDIAVIPILALLPLLALGTAAPAETAGHASLLEGLPVWIQVVATLGTIAGIILAGQYLANPIIRVIASTRLRELFTAFSLLLVVAIAVLMQAVGLSPALGSFVAGVVLAESEFRHEIEVDIEPFKGLLLGLFFITVGASIDFNVLTTYPVMIALAVVSLILIKGLLIAGIAASFKMERNQLLLLSVALAQGGEFAFVIVSAARQYAVFDSEISSLVTVVVALSMLISPLLIVLVDNWLGRADQNTEMEEEVFEEEADVIIAGYGRFGQIVGRLLNAEGYQLSILDHSPSQIEMVRRFGNKVFYGDASRRDLLHAAGADDAKMIVIAVDEASKALEIIETVKKHFPHLKILARAVDRRHAYALMNQQIDGFQRETFESALGLGVDALQALGRTEADANRIGALFRDHDKASLASLFEVWGDDQSYGVAMRQRLEDLSQVLAADSQAQKKAQKKAQNTVAQNKSAQNKTAPPETPI